jgi:hypothetical protein
LTFTNFLKGVSNQQYTKYDKEISYILAVLLVFSFIARKSRKNVRTRRVTIEDGGQILADREAHFQLNFSTLYLNIAQTKNIAIG